MGLSEILGGIPGIEVQDRFNYSLGDRISIRGFGARTQFGVRGIKVFVDGLPATLADGQTTLDHLDMGAVRRVEVMRGPASAVYGNASGGVIRFETAMLRGGAATGSLDTRLGGLGLRRVQGASSGSFGSTRYSVDLSRRTYEGYRTHSQADHTTATAHVVRHVGASRLRLSGSLVDFDAQNPGSLNATQLATDRDAARVFNISQDARKDVTQGQIGFSWRHYGDVLFGLTTYGLFRRLDNPIAVRVIDLDRSAAGARLEARGNSTDDISWALGVSTDYQRDDRRNFDNLSGTSGAVRLDQLEEVVNVAPFAQASLRLGTRADLHGALRFDRVRFDAEDRLLVDGDDSGTRTMSAWSPSIGLSYRAGAQHLVYGNFSTAFETPTTTELANRPDGSGGFNGSLEPQRTHSVEIGWRGELLENVSVDAALYRADVSNELTPFEAGSSGRTFFRNAGSATHRGIEVGAVVAKQLFTARGTYTYQDIHFDSFSVSGITFDGNQVPGVTPHRWEFEFSYTPQPWFVTLNGRRNSRLAVNDANSEFSPSYFVVDFQAGTRNLNLAGVSASASLGINNLFATDYNSSIAVNAFGGRYFEPGPGRMVFVGVRVAKR